MKNRDLLESELIQLDETIIITEEERELIIREHSIQIILERLNWDKELRRRVRAHLKKLPPENHPGEEPVLSDAVIYHLVNAINSSGMTMKKAHELIARPGLSAESIKTKYYRGKAKFKAKK